MDEKTGLPEVPKGYFWRVKRASALITAPKVQLRKKMWIGSYVIDDAWTLDEYESTGQQVRALAKSIMRRQEAENRRVSELARVVGDYPPNSLA